MFLKQYADKIAHVYVLIIGLVICFCMASLDLRKVNLHEFGLVVGSVITLSSFLLHPIKQTSQLLLNMMQYFFILYSVHYLILLFLYYNI